MEPTRCGPLTGAGTIEEGTGQQMFEPWRETATAEMPPKTEREGGYTLTVSFPSFQILASASHLPNLSRSQFEREPGNCSLQGSGP